MKSIVVPVNFSDNSSNAARYAADMALAIDADIHLIYVLQFPMTAAEVPMPDYVFEEMQRSGQILLESLSEELVKRTREQVKVTTNMETGGVEYKLEEFCKRLKPFVVVMGASGHTLDTVLAGSSTVKAMRHLPYPLLIIPEKAVFHAIKKIVLACELDDIGSALPVSLPFLKELRNLFGSHFEVVNVATKAEQSEGQAVFQFDSWKDRLQEIFPEVHFIRTDNIEEGINQYLGENHADWLMVFPKKHSFFEFHSSKSKKIAKDCPVPVMSVHE